MTYRQPDGTGRCVGQHPCARCDWKPEDKADAQQFREHALTSGHPLCICCTRSLADYETQTCEKCMSAAQADLAAIVDLYALLPGQLGHAKAQVYDTDRRGGDEFVLPGGDVLVLLGPGGTGAQSHGRDSQDDDPVSVAFVLGQAEDDWRHTRGESAAETVATVAGSAGYLERRMRWAANNHYAFDEFRAELRSLRGMLERANKMDQPVIRAEAECFGCGSDSLVRTVTDQGYDDFWTCQRCGDVYQWKRYILALSERLQDTEAAGWTLPDHAAFALGVPVQTVRTWAKRGLVSVACIRDDKRMRVWFPEVKERAETRPRKRSA